MPVPLTDEQRAEVESSLRLVNYFAGWYRDFDSTEMEDLKQEIAIALIDAVQSPLRKRFAVSTLLSQYARRAAAVVRRRRVLVKMPRYCTLPIISLDVPMGENPDGPSLLDTLADNSPSIDETVSARETVAAMPIRTREFFRMRAYGMKLRHIGETAGLSRETVRNELTEGLSGEGKSKREYRRRNCCPVVG